MLTPLFVQFAISTTMVVVCVIIHGVGLFSLSRVLRTESSMEHLRQIDALSWHGAKFTLSIVLAIIALHGLEIWAFTFLYLGIDALPTLEDALYYSTLSYSTVGYTDIHVAKAWRLLGAFESILGMILLGWSTAFFFRVLRRIDAH